MRPPPEKHPLTSLTVTHLEILPTAVKVDARDLHRATFTLLSGRNDRDLDEHPARSRPTDADDAAENGPRRRLRDAKHLALRHGQDDGCECPNQHKRDKDIDRVLETHVEIPLSQHSLPQRSGCAAHPVQRRSGRRR